MTGTVRNVLIIVALAAVVAFAPGGGRTADFITAALSIAITAVLVVLAGRFYREHRVGVFSLGDRHRGLLYGALGAIVIAMAGRDRLFDTAAGTLAWLVLIGGAVAALYAVWRHHRSYGY